jgi:DNA-binding IclR family transcriptional regulator
MTETARDDGNGRSRSVQSVSISVEILRALAAAGGPLALSDIAARVRMPAAKVHRYLAGFCDAGMVDHRRSGTYDLGPVAAEIGMAAVTRVDVVNRAADALPALVDDTGCTAMLSVWGTRGPTVVRWERARRPLVTVLGVGSVLPVLQTATGRAFLAHLPDRVVEEALGAQPASGISADVAAIRADVRKKHIATADETYIPGLYALARPVLDLQDTAAAAVTLISTDRATL